MSASLAWVKLGGQKVFVAHMAGCHMAALDFNSPENLNKGKKPQMLNEFLLLSVMEVACVKANGNRIIHYADNAV